jgi:hypothetical protein
MKMAALDVLEPLLQQLRGVDDLFEVKHGMFSRKSEPRRPFLHFHEDAAGLVADLRIGRMTRRSASLSSVGNRAKAQGWLRFPVNNSGEQAELFDSVIQCLKRN